MHFALHFMPHTCSISSEVRCVTLNVGIHGGKKKKINEYNNLFIFISPTVCLHGSQCDTGWTGYNCKKGLVLDTVQMPLELYTQQSANLSVRTESVYYLIPAHVTVDGLDHAVKMVFKINVKRKNSVS